ncbi:MAG: phosphotransferase [Clostridia bacterium]|nr:phosphotransferase [Clostridia bacterium]
MNNTKSTHIDPAIKELFSRFFDGKPISAELIDTSRGEDDFRNTLIITTDGGERSVLKIVSNDFTFPERIRMWQRTAEEYRDLGYYCPRIYCDKSGGFPVIEYRGKRCIVYAEEFSIFKPLSDRAADGSDQAVSAKAYFKDIWSMSAKLAAKKLDYTKSPSGYCLFETFCPSDRTDEVMENALEWKEYALSLPVEFSEQVQRIWDAWSANREALKERYFLLPTSVFQADLNPTNLLIDDSGAFRGVYDFNLCGRDVFLNYLMRENYADFEEEIELIRSALTIAKEHYAFSEDEKAAALPLYRCIKPLWYTRVYDLKQAGNDAAEIKHCLDRIEHYLTADIDFISYMD